MNCAEINSSFYRPHCASTWQKWAASVPETFRFSVKAPKTITHEAKLQQVAPLLEAFLVQARELGSRLGPLLFQLPPKLDCNLDQAAEFFQTVRASHEGPVVLEPRHPSWFTPEAGKLLADFRIARCAADPAIVPEAARPGGWPGLLYYRLHGSPRMYYDSYSDGFLRGLAQDISTHRATEEAWFIFDNTASGAALGDAFRLNDFLP